MLCVSVRFSGKFAMILPAREMSLVSTATPVPFVKTWTIGRKEYVARAGASSVFVQMIFDVLVVILSPFVVFRGLLGQSGEGSSSPNTGRRTRDHLCCIQYTKDCQEKIHSTGAEGGTRTLTRFPEWIGVGKKRGARPIRWGKRRNTGT